MSYKNGSIIGTIVMLPLLFGALHLASWAMSDRQIVVLITPRNSSAFLNDDSIPKKTAVNYDKQGLPLEYRFGIDDGDYKLRVTVDKGGPSIEQTIEIDRDEGAEYHITVVAGDAGLTFDVNH